MSAPARRLQGSERGPQYHRGRRYDRYIRISLDNEILALIEAIARKIGLAGTAGRPVIFERAILHYAKEMGVPLPKLQPDGEVKIVEALIALSKQKRE